MSGNDDRASRPKRTPSAEWLESDPAIQIEVSDLITAPHNVDELPGYELGFRRGIELGFDRAMSAVLPSLIAAGVDPQQRQAIIDALRKRIAGG